MKEPLSRVGRFFRGLNRLPNRVARLERAVNGLSAELREQRRENQLLLGALSRPHPTLWDQPPVPSPSEPDDSVFASAAMCRQDSFRQPYFAYWTAQIGAHHGYHRKLWEFVFICQALWERGLIAPGRRGLGFGVGLESLPAFFASRGVEIMATDLAADSAVDLGWKTTNAVNQHVSEKAALRRPELCPDDLFERNVAFRACDMNAVPDSLRDFDFCWSACALEHLGSIEKGLAFIERSVDCLKPGGWAVHTTEYNVSSNTDTVDNELTVLFRRRDLEDLAERLRAKGHHVAPINWDPGNEPLDQYYDVPPYRNGPHLKIALAGFAITSIGFIVQRGD